MENNRFKIDFTGERMINDEKSDLYKISFERYCFASKFVKKDSIILDIACGSGYGTNFLAERSGYGVGMDVDRGIINYCVNKYKRDNLNFFQIKNGEIMENFKNFFDVIVSFETIEHVNDYHNFLEGLKFYLKSGGTIILSTPNNFKKINPPENKFHKHEFDIKKLYGILKNTFYNYQIEIFGQVKTKIKRSNHYNNTQKNIFRKIISKFINFLYNADKKYLNLLVNLEHTELYKTIGGLQRDFKINPTIYPIDINDNFYNPSISLYIIKDQKNETR